jgi:hypothetical protein
VETAKGNTSHPKKEMEKEGGKPGDELPVAHVVSYKGPKNKAGLKEGEGGTEGGREEGREGGKEGKREGHPNGTPAPGHSRGKVR